MSSSHFASFHRLETSKKNPQMRRSNLIISYHVLFVLWKISARKIMNVTWNKHSGLSTSNPDELTGLDVFSLSLARNYHTNHARGPFYKHGLTLNPARKKITPMIQCGTKLLIRSQDVIPKFTEHYSSINQTNQLWVQCHLVHCWEKNTAFERRNDGFNDVIHY